MKRRDFLHSSLWGAAAALPGIRAAYAVVGTGNDPVADVAAVTGDGRAITLRGADIRDLAARLRGRLLVAGDDGYETARLVLNPSFDKHPALIAQPTGSADVQSAVRFARAHDLLVAVKCGGHSASGQSSCDRGLQIDLSNMRGVRVDPQARRAWVEGGTLLGQVDHECMAHGLVTPLGTVSHTGVGGLTLGGGFGRLARRFGLAIDNLESVDIVTADGELRHASAKENRDLFWAVRGGGGNFGVVTTFEFRLHPMQREVFAGEIVYPFERAKDVLHMWADYAATAPDELYMDPTVFIPTGGKPGAVYLEVCYSGAKKDVEKALAPIRKLGTPTNDGIAPKEYLRVQRANDSSDNRSLATYLKGGFVSRVPGELVDAIVDDFRGDPNRITVLFFQHCGGAAGRIPESDTAFAQRDAIANMMAVSGWNVGNVEGAPHMQAIREYWTKLEPFTRGFYINDLAREVTTKDISSNYRGNLPRLVAVKKQYDPTNLFRLNANVQLSAG